MLSFLVSQRSNTCYYLSAYLDDSKVAEYLTNREYFIELAKKQPKRCNASRFQTSVKSADLIC